MVLAVCFIEGWVISRSHCFGRKEMEFGQKHYLSQMDSAKRDSSSCENAIMYLSKRENWRSKRNSLCCVKSFHHLKLARIQWSGEGPPQWEEQILLLSLPSKNSPGVSRSSLLGLVFQHYDDDDEHLLTAWGWHSCCWDVVKAKNFWLRKEREALV